MSWNKPPISNGNNMAFGSTTWTMNSASTDFKSFGDIGSIQQEKKSLLQLANNSPNMMSMSSKQSLLQPTGKSNGEQSTGSSLSQQDILDFLS